METPLNYNETALAAPAAPVSPGGLTRAATDGLGQTEIEQSGERASTAVAAQVSATIQARTVLALQRPRDWDDVRSAILQDCKRPGFARAARYAKPVGGRAIEGASIRFVEAALRSMGNVLSDSMVIYDDPTKRIVRVTVADLERNTAFTSDVTVEKAVERRQPRPGEQVLSQRINSQGKTTFTVRATEDDLLNKEAARVSKAIRNLGIRILPADIVDESMALCIKVARSADAQDPGAAKNAVMDAFANLGIPPSEVKEYVGKDLAQLSPADITDLRAKFMAIKDGEVTWRELLAAKAEELAADDPGAPQKGGMAALKAKAVTAKAA